MTDNKIEQLAEEFKKRPHYSNGATLSVTPQLYLKRGFIAGYKAALSQPKEEAIKKAIDYFEDQIKIIGVIGTREAGVLRSLKEAASETKDSGSYVVSGGLQPIGELGGKRLDIQPIPKPAVYRGTFEDIENALFDYYTKQDLANAASKAHSIVWLLKNDSQPIPKEDKEAIKKDLLIGLDRFRDSKYDCIDWIFKYFTITRKNK